LYQLLSKRPENKKSTENKKDSHTYIEPVNVGPTRICVSNGVSGNKRYVVHDNENCGETSE
jgi:hypothetical protein